MELKKRGLDCALVDVADMDMAFKGTLRKTERRNDYMRCLVLCNESLPGVKNGERDSTLTSPDEVALSRVVAKVGFEMTARTPTRIDGVIDGEKEACDIVAAFSFNAEPRRMAFFVLESGGYLVLYI